MFMSNVVVPVDFSKQMPELVRDTLSEVLNDPTINQHFGGRDERLSPHISQPCRFE
jgi:hypothetical protein